MLAKWKSIITNWINCYFHDTSHTHLSLSHDSLLNVISLLHKNSLDETKSSLLEAETIEGFITEKYPLFKFKDGTVVPRSNEDLYLVASLLLLFVCVKSKDEDLKCAMCNKLGAEDQDSILKFSKYLMECSAVTFEEVQNAILDASGQDVASCQDTEWTVKVSETPPVLRSLHSEVRRLQAALDAEKFDRNFLQEELTRTQHQVEKLTKDKEQCKLEISDLKQRVSQSSGDNTGKAEGDGDNSRRLQREVDDLEQKLIELRSQTDDIVYERDNYKTKVDDLKKERDKWLKCSQEEADRAALLAVQLSEERKSLEALQDLVNELQQHHRQNLDGSLFECDNPDVSIHPQNVSICNEACANVIEVQLSEERIKVEEFRKQLQSQKEQFEQMLSQLEKEKMSLEKIIADKDEDMMNLKHRINEEIEEKNNMKSHYSNEISQLTNEIGELEQKLRHSNESNKVIIESKLEHIQVLEEEKLSLIQSIADANEKYEKNKQKLNRDIDDLRAELNTEKNMKHQLKDDYENKIMKLNEKVLNRNNELVELQNNVCAKSEKIESMRVELQQQKEMHSAFVANATKTISELTEEKKLHENQIEELKHALEEVKLQSTSEIELCENEIQLHRSEIQNLKEAWYEQEKIFNLEIDENRKSLQVLKEDLQAQTSLNETLQMQLTELIDHKELLNRQLNELNEKHCSICLEVQEKNTMLDALDMYLNEEKQAHQNLQQEYDELKEEHKDLSDKILLKDTHIQKLQEEVHKKHLGIQNNLQEKEVLLSQIAELSNEKIELLSQIERNDNDVILLKEETVKLSFILEDNKKVIAELNDTNNNHVSKISQLEKDYDKVMVRIKETERIFKEQRLKYKSSLQEKDETIEKLNKDISIMEQNILQEKHAIELLETEKSKLIEQITVEVALKDKWEKEYQNQLTILEDAQKQLSSLAKEMDTLKEDYKQLQSTHIKDKENIKNIENQMKEERKLAEESIYMLEKKVSDRCKEVEDIESKLSEVNKSLCSKDKEMKTLKNEITSLLHTLQIQQDNVDEIKHEKEVLENRVSLEKQALDFSNAEKNYLSSEIHDTLNALNKLQQQFLHNKNQLNEVAQTLSNELAVKEKLILENSELHTNFKILTQQLIECQSAKDLLVSEKNSLSKQVTDLEVNVAKIMQQLESHTESTKAFEIRSVNLSNEIETLARQLENEQKAVQQAEHEKENLMTLNKKLLQSVADERQKLQVLVEDKTALLTEKENLSCLLVAEKASKDETENEKQAKIMELEEKTKEIAEILTEMNSLQNTCFEKDKFTDDISKLVDSGLHDVINAIKNENRQNEVLNKFISLTSNPELSLNQQCDILINIAQCLTSELSVKNKLEKALEDENCCIKQLNECIKQKDMMLHNLEMDLKELQGKLGESQNELNKQRNSYIATLEDSSRVIQTLKNDNDSLSNELTSVKVQLETKVHSLKEKIMDNENLTDKLKQSYETQIDNLNLMTTKLSTYLKEKTIELDALKKEKEKLQIVIEENNESIASLEAKLKTQQSSQEKLISDFESERQVLKNMVAVTESVMEDQKQSLEQTIDERNSIIDKLNGENKILRDSMETEKSNYHTLIKNKEMEAVAVFKELETKEATVKEINVVVKKLENEIKDHVSRIAELEREKEILSNQLQEAKTEINTLSEINNQEEQMIEYANTEKSSLVENITILQNEIQEKEQKINTIFIENQDYKVKMEQVQLELTELNKANTEYKSSIIEQENKVKELHTMNKAYIENINVLQNDLTERNKINMEYKQKLQLIEEQMAVLTKTNEEYEELANRLENEIADLNKIHNENELKMEELTNDVTDLKRTNNDYKMKIEKAENQIHELNKTIQTFEEKLKDREMEVTELKHIINENENRMAVLQKTVEELSTVNIELKAQIDDSQNECSKINKDKASLEELITNLNSDIDRLKSQIQSDSNTHVESVTKLQSENSKLSCMIEENKSVIENLEVQLEQNKVLREDNSLDKLNLINKCNLLEQYQEKAEKIIEDKNREISSLATEQKLLKSKLDDLSAVEQKLEENEKVLANLKDDMEKAIIEKETLVAEIEELKSIIKETTELKVELESLKKENEELQIALSEREHSSSKSKRSKSDIKNWSEKHRDLQLQVDMSSSDTQHCSDDSIKTITDLEKIIQDKNRNITTLQSDITYMKTIMAESENKLLDVTKDLEISKETCEQLSRQLKKLAQQKNDELNELKKQISKKVATENRATEIIKLSAKYQAMIHKRVQEIKSTNILKELTNLNENANVDNELRRSIAANITMEDLENFLENTDKHIKRCGEKHSMLQKERDRLAEINRINESEMISMKKFLAELSITFTTFASVKEVYSQKLSRVVSMQRAVRREIYNLDGHITDGTMSRLERGYSAVMQDLTECVLNMERWVERCLERSVSVEKIKQASATDMCRGSISSGSFVNTALEVQLDELEKSFQKLVEEIRRAQKGEGGKDAQAVTVMEVRAEYEDKLNRMKAKMKQLYQEQIGMFKEKQREEIAVLEKELQKARDQLAESSRAYEEHIRSLTMELWSVGERFLVQKDEADWLRGRRGGSMQTLPRTHSTGILETSRESDAFTLHSLPTRSKKSARGLHMSDEEGEVFDNRCLPELRTPKPANSHDNGGPRTPARLSELRWRNSLCPPHLKSSYPAETQFATLHEDDIKNAGVVKGQRKEVGITAYKKPGPPTPSKQAGRLSATDSELRDSLRLEPEPRKTSTPSRLRALFRSRHDTNDGTPRKRLSIFRSKK